MGDNEVSVFYTSIDGKPSVKVTQTNTDWTIKLILPNMNQPKEVIGELELLENEAMVTGKGDTISITY